MSQYTPEQLRSYADWLDDGRTDTDPPSDCQFIGSVELLRAMATMMERTEVNERTRGSIDGLLEQAGFAPDSSIRNLLGCMNFDRAAFPKEGA